jgi:hypothetical protein
MVIPVTLLPPWCMTPDMPTAACCRKEAMHLGCRVHDMLQHSQRFFWSAGRLRGGPRIHCAGGRVGGSIPRRQPRLPGPFRLRRLRPCSCLAAMHAPAVRAAPLACSSHMPFPGNLAHGCKCATVCRADISRLCMVAARHRRPPLRLGGARSGGGPDFPHDVRHAVAGAVPLCAESAAAAGYASVRRRQLHAAKLAKVFRS